MSGRHRKENGGARWPIDQPETRTGKGKHVAKGEIEPAGSQDKAAKEAQEKRTQQRKADIEEANRIVPDDKKGK